MTVFIGLPSPLERAGILARAISDAARPQTGLAARVCARSLRQRWFWVNPYAVCFQLRENLSGMTGLERKADPKFGGEKRDKDLHNLKQFLSLLGIF